MSLTRTGKKREDRAAEVVGSTPTQSIFINLVEYGIDLRLILTIVGQGASNANRALFHITR